MYTREHAKNTRTRACSFYLCYIGVRIVDTTIGSYIIRRKAHQSPRTRMRMENDRGRHFLRARVRSSVYSFLVQALVVALAGTCAALPPSDAAAC